MLRLRFLPGLILGVLIGLPAGITIALFVLPPRALEQNASTSPLVQDLTRKLDAAREARERADRQIEQFQKLAEQMTASFNNLETRFKALEEEQRVRMARPAPPVAVPPHAAAPVPAVPTATVPTPPPQPDSSEAQAPDDAGAAAEPEVPADLDRTAPGDLSDLAGARDSTAS